MSSESRKIAYYCMACPDVFYDAETSNAHHDATGHNQHWLESRSFAARQRPASPPSPTLAHAAKLTAELEAVPSHTTPAPRCEECAKTRDKDAAYCAHEVQPAARSRPAPERLIALHAIAHLATISAPAAESITRYVASLESRLASPPAGAEIDASTEFSLSHAREQVASTFTLRGAPETAPLTDAAELAQRFHETYERLAPSFGYETRKASAKPWADVPEQNRALMTAVCAEILAASLTEVKDG